MPSTCPEPSLLVELLKATPSIVTAITAIVGVSVAWAGLHRWRAETLGKRKADLAEQVLTGFLEVKDIFVWVRSPGSFGGEGTSRAPAADETPSQQQQRNTWFIPLERLTREKELFARLQTLQYAFAAHFGKAARAPFRVIREAHDEIFVAARMLIQMTNHAGSTAGYMNDANASLRHTLWGGPERPDIVDRNVDQAVEDIETLCRPILSAKGGRLQKSKKVVE